MARPAKTNVDGTPAKAARPVGPKTLFLIFNPGTDPALVDAFKANLASVTMNGRSLIKALQGGTPSPFLSYTVQAEKRGAGEAE